MLCVHDVALTAAITGEAGRTQGSGLGQSRRVRGLALLVSLLALLPHPARSAQPAFTLEQVLGYTFPESLAASAPGSKIAWTFNVRGRSNVWVAAAPDFKARPLKDLLLESYEKPADAQRALDVGWQSSPVSAVSTWRSPVLFIHGDDDRNVPFSQTVDLVRRLGAAGVDHEVVSSPDETHNVVRYANVLTMYRAIVEFLDRHLTDEAR